MYFKALGDLIKAITAMPSEESVLSLPPQPLLRMLGYVMSQHVTSTWLTLATILIGQLHPPKTIETLNSNSVEIQQFVYEFVTIIIVPVLRFLSASSMEEVGVLALVCLLLTFCRIQILFKIFLDFAKRYENNFQVDKLFNIGSTR